MKDPTPEEHIKFLKKELDKWRKMAMRLLREKYQTLNRREDKYNDYHSKYKSIYMKMPTPKNPHDER